MEKILYVLSISRAIAMSLDPKKIHRLSTGLKRPSLRYSIDPFFIYTVNREFMKKFSK